MCRQKKTINTAPLIDRVWGHGVYVEERTVDVHLSRLRKALDQVGDAPLPNLIRTVRGSGYALQSR